jgi:hypothetical protein
MSNNSVKSNNPQMSQEDIRMENKILSFNKKMKKAKENSEKSTISIDSAIFYLEAVANYNFVEPVSVTNKFTDSIIISIPSMGDQVLLADIAASYLLINDDTKQHYDDIQSPEKHILSVDVELKEATGDTKTAKITTTYGYGHNIPASDCYEPYTESMDWVLAGESFQNRINYPPSDCPDIISLNSEYYYFTDQYTVTVSAIDNPSYVNKIPYKPFSPYSEEWIFCPNLMNSYFNWVDNVILQEYEEMNDNLGRIFRYDLFSVMSIQYDWQWANENEKVMYYTITFAVKHFRDHLHDVPMFTD